MELASVGAPTVPAAADRGLTLSQRPQVEVVTGDRIQGTDAASLASPERVREGRRGHAAMVETGEDLPPPRS